MSEFIHPRVGFFDYFRKQYNPDQKNEVTIHLVTGKEIVVKVNKNFKAWVTGENLLEIEITIPEEHQDFEPARKMYQIALDKILYMEGL